MVKEQLSNDESRQKEFVSKIARLGTAIIKYKKDRDTAKLSFDEVVKLKEEVLNDGRILKLPEDIIIQMVYDVTKKALSEWYIRRVFSEGFSRKMLPKKSEDSEKIPKKEIEENICDANVRLKRDSTNSFDVTDKYLPPIAVERQNYLVPKVESGDIYILKEGAITEIEYLKEQKNIEGFVKITPTLYRQLKETVIKAIHDKLPFIRIEYQGDEAMYIDTI